MLRAVYFASARKDIVEIAHFIAADSVEVGHRFYEMVDRTVEEVRGFPSMGRLWRPRSARLGEVRFIPVRTFRQYLLFYRERANRVEVLRVMHGSRNLMRVLTPVTLGLT